MVPHQNTHYILHHNDTIAEIMRIINQSSTAEIFIYVPEDMDMLYNKTNIALLARVLGKLPSSKQVTFFTPNYHLVDLLQSYRIQAQHSEQIQDHTEPEEDPFADFFNYKEENEFDHTQPPKPSSGTKWSIPWKAILGGMSIGVVCLAVFFITTIPQADVRISQTGDWKEIDFEVRFDPNRNTLDEEGYRVPVSEETVTESIEKTFEATGTSDDGTRARATIEVKNDSSVDQPLVSNTRFRTEGGLQYRTTSRITVPANGSTEVEVVADEAGETYNIEPQDLEIPGLEGTGRFDQVYGVVSQDIESGTSGDRRFVTEEDIAQAKQSLEKEVKKQLESKEIIINEERKKMVDVGDEETTISFSKEPKVNEEIDEFSLSATAEQSRWVFDEEHIKRLIDENIDTTFMDNKYLSDEVTVGFGEPIEGEFPQEVLIRVFSEYALLDNLQADEVAKDLTGKSVEYTEEYLNKYDSVDSYEVTRSPQYWPFLPFFDYQIEVTINR